MNVQLVFISIALKGGSLLLEKLTTTKKQKGSVF